MLPPSLPPPDDDERSELDALRIENETLRLKLGSLEEKVNKHIAGGEPVSPTTRGEVGGGEERPFLTGEDVADLNDMMVKIQLAKEEALKHGDERSSREQLINDIHFLYDMLMSAKEERSDLFRRIEQGDRKLKEQRALHEKLQAKRTQDKIIFVEMLKRERLSFEGRLVESDRKVLFFEQEMRRVAQWARERQKEYNSAASNMHKLLVEAKRETVEMANHTNMDLASELESLRYEASEMIR